jgi:CHAT domain-containing protein
LSGTLTEVEAISNIVRRHEDWQVEVLTNERATKRSLLGVRSPRIVHIATHGYFLRPLAEPTPAPGADRSFAPTLPGAPDPGFQNWVRTQSHPLLWSGLALAGANRWREAAADAAGGGLLTALEAGYLPLADTELVALSACNTGSGYQPRLEGIFGLPRSILAAGARSLLMSLWAVPDAETSDLMQQFYRIWFQGTGKLDAFHEAQLSLIKQLRGRHGFAHPFLFGGMILMGDWR